MTLPLEPGRWSAPRADQSVRVYCSKEGIQISKPVSKVSRFHPAKPSGKTRSLPNVAADNGSFRCIGMVKLQVEVNPLVRMAGGQCPSKEGALTTTTAMGNWSIN
jgi:hypothetical protein